MKFEIVELTDFSGQKASVYSIKFEDETDTLLDKFLIENNSKYPEELDSIFETIYQIANYHGARRQYFKENEGKIGDLVCALYDNPNSNLRLYCIRFGTTVILLGGGGFKAKEIRALQEDPKLKSENYLIRQISELINQKMKEKDIYWENEFKLNGNLIIDTNE
jgi:predicted house-cleaning noncanonical NTP pyrophosphatase (MazG superfamily)